MRTRSQSRGPRPPHQKGTASLIIEPLRIGITISGRSTIEPKAALELWPQLLQAPTEEQTVLVPVNDKEDRIALIGAARIWLEKESPSIHSNMGDLVSKFINQFFPPSRRRNLRNEYHQISAEIELRKQVGNFWKKNASRMFKNHREQVQGSSNTSQGSFAKVKTEEPSSAPAPAPAPVKAVELSCVIVGGAIFNQNCQPLMATIIGTNISLKVELLSVPHFSTESTFIDPRCLIQSPAYLSPRSSDTRTRCILLFSGSTEDVQPPVVQSQSRNPVLEPIVAPVVAPMPNTKPTVSLPYPSRRDNEKSRNQANEQIDKFYEIFKEMSFEISFTDALVLMHAQIRLDSKNLTWE
ncbi:hypothetical protein Tco_0013673 [Tanacetum coccineum]